MPPPPLPLPAPPRHQRCTSPYTRRHIGPPPLPAVGRTAAAVGRTAHMGVAMAKRGRRGPSVGRKDPPPRVTHLLSQAAPAAVAGVALHPRKIHNRGSQRRGSPRRRTQSGSESGSETRPQWLSRSVSACVVATASTPRAVSTRWGRAIMLPSVG